MDTALTLLEQALASPWLYVVILVVVAVDAAFPVVPAETVVITAGAHAAAQPSPHALSIAAAAALGAVAGDHLCHQLGRSAGPAARRLQRTRVGDGMYRWARDGLHRRGGMVIIGARFIPGGRTATTLTSGLVGYPRARFVLYSGLAGLAWAAYSTGIGLAGGVVFREQPLIGVAVGIGLALVVGAGVELGRRLRHGAAPRRDGPRSPSVRAGGGR